MNEARILELARTLRNPNRRQVEDLLRKVVKELRPRKLGKPAAYFFGPGQPVLPDALTAEQKKQATPLYFSPSAVAEVAKPGCYCQPGRCMAPVVMGNQTPCRDPVRREATSAEDYFRRQEEMSDGLGGPGQRPEEGRGKP